MPKQNTLLSAFNRGIVSRNALARVDVDRIRLSAETQTNWLPRTLGPMMLRPGLEYIASTKDDAKCKVVPFIFSSSDTAALEMTNLAMRVLINDTPMARVSVSTSVSNFTSPGSWVTASSGGGTASVSSSKLTLNLGSLGGSATATQTVALGAGASGVEHALRIVVDRGPVKFRVGTTAGADNLFSTTYLDEGMHSLAFTPTAQFFIQFEAASGLDKIVSLISLEGSGVVSITTPYTENDLPLLRMDQSADVIFVACKGHQQRRIERRSTRSWSVVLYKANDGPFNSNTDDSISITPSALRGTATLTASRGIFRAAHLGALFRLYHSGQQASAGISAANTFSATIKVTGVGSTRSFSTTISGTWSGSLTLQRSFDSATTGFLDVSTQTGNTTFSTSDGLDNSICWYRIGFKTGDYTSGTANVLLSYGSGGGAGVGRVTKFTSDTSVDVEVVSDFLNTTATTDWKEGAWSDRLGWPTSDALFEGRLWWAGNDRWWGSVSDNYTSYNADVEGDSGLIDRSIGQGPIATINWLAPLQRLIAGADASIIQAKSSSFDEPLTPTNFNLKAFVTQGATSLPAVKVDQRVVFVQQSNRRVYHITYDANIYDYAAQDLTRLNDDIGLPGFIDIAVQRQPDTYLHFSLGDGTAAVFLYDYQDQVEAWWKIETDGVIESCYVLPGQIEDKVYYVVRRTINGVTKRYHERFAMMTECEGGTLNKQADAFKVYSGSLTATITGLGHLEGKQVVAWADGKDFSPGYGASQTLYTVTGGQITLPTAVSHAVVGLPYKATYKSSKLAYASAGGTAITQKKRIDHIGLVLGPTHNRGLRYGDNLDHLYPMPQIEDTGPVAVDDVYQTYDAQMFPLGGSWDTDSRLLLEAMAPRPANVQAVVLSMTTNG